MHLIAQGYSKFKSKIRMKIYHYTTIETLALILKHRTIRFNRLDRVDDIEETEYGSSSALIKTGQYNFVSCWTKEDKENVGLWGLYTRYKGVRISMDEDMFVTYPINNMNQGQSFYPDVECGDNYVITLTDSLNELSEVRYVEDLEGTIKDHGTLLTAEATETHIPFMISPLIGTFKREHWSFQKECRFKIRATPITPNLIKTPQDWYDKLPHICSIVGDLMADDVPISKEYIDIKLEEQAYINMEIMLGPLTSDADRIIVDSLIREFGLLNKATDSYFKGKIREKKIS